MNASKIRNKKSLSVFRVEEIGSLHNTITVNSREGTIVFHRIFGLPWGDYGTIGSSVSEHAGDKITPRNSDENFVLSEFLLICQCLRS